MTKKILVMGLPGAGKTTFTQELVKKLMLTRTVSWFNADSVREQFNDWDFSPEGRKRQVERMSKMANNATADYAICDFVCPTDELRSIFDADIVIWLDTIKEGRFEDTNKAFVVPTKYDFRITDWSDTWVKSVAASLTKPAGESHLRSIAKAVSWRTLGTVDTFILSFIITGQAKMALAISGVEIFTKVFLFWAHERIWTKVRWGR